MPVYFVTVRGKEYAVSIGADGQLSVDGLQHHLEVTIAGDGLYSVLVGTESHPTKVTESSGGYAALVGCHQLDVTVEGERDRLLKRYGASSVSAHRKDEIHAPMPALVVRVEVEEGQEVREGQPLIILEAMKMENEIRAHQASKVKRVLARAGTAVEKGELLLLLE